MERTYSDSELEEMKPERHKFTYEGKEWNQYSASQQQRRIERTIRKQTRLQKSFEAAGLTDEAAAAGAKLRALRKEYRQFSEAAGLPEQRERMKVLYT